MFGADDTNARSMRISIAYAGTYEACTGDDRAFGGNGGTASGGRFYFCNGNGPNAWAGDETTTLYCIKNGAAYP